MSSVGAVGIYFLSLLSLILVTVLVFVYKASSFKKLCASAFLAGSLLLYPTIFHQEAVFAYNYLKYGNCAGAT